MCLGRRKGVSESESEEVGEEGEGESRSMSVSTEGGVVGRRVGVEGWGG